MVINTLYICRAELDVVPSRKIAGDAEPDFKRRSEKEMYFHTYTSFPIHHSMVELCICYGTFWVMLRKILQGSGA